MFGERVLLDSLFYTIIEVGFQGTNLWTCGKSSNWRRHGENKVLSPTNTSVNYTFV